jgi:recombination protein RecA
LARKGNKSAAQALASRVNAQMGKPVVMMATDDRFQVRRVPIGSLVMERITGGGFARGRHIELYGNESSGKSFVLYRTMALAQERGELCALVDAEHVFDEAWFRRLGGRPEELVGLYPENAEDVIKILMLFAEQDDNVAAASIVGIDSVASLLPLEELAKDPSEGDDRIGSQARMMSRLLRRVTTVNRDTIFLWTNQVRDKINAYGGGVNTPGGRALKFYATTRIEMVKSERVKQERVRAIKGKEVRKPTTVGRWVQVRSEKEKSSRPEMESMFYFDMERGEIDRAMEIVTLGLEDGLISRSANTFLFEDSEGNTWSGLPGKFRQIINDNDDVREELEWAITENTKLLSAPEDDNGA